VARRKGRILAFQALYAWEVGQCDRDLLFAFSWAEVDAQNTPNESVVAFARLLTAGTLEHLEQIDELIKAHLHNWDFTRVSKVDLSIIRISVYPLLYQKDIHPSIIIDEAISLAKDFASDDSFKFINAVLDSISKDLANSG
jgi:N utilization substance protein B